MAAEEKENSGAGTAKEYLACFMSGTGNGHRAYRERYYKIVQAGNKREALREAMGWLDNEHDEVVTAVRVRK